MRAAILSTDQEGKRERGPKRKKEKKGGERGLQKGVMGLERSCVRVCV